MNNNQKTTHSYLYPLTLFAWLISPDALALEMEFYTYGGFQEIVDTFRRLALIYSDNRLATMFTVAAGLGAIIMATNSSIMAPIMGGRVDPFAWLKTVVLGTTVFTATIIPTGVLHIYDPTTNATQSVANVPDGIILIAGLFNKLERGMVDITTTASAYPYDKTAGGINFKLLMDTLYKTQRNNLHYLSADVKEYYAVCGTLAEGIPGTNTSAKILKSQTTSLFAELQKYKNPAVWVNLYNGNKTKTNMTCSEAWDNVISPTLTPAVMEEMTRSICQSNNFDPNNLSALNACKSLIEQFYTLHGQTTVDANSYVREAFIYKSILNALTSDPQEAQLMLSRRALVLQGIGAFNSANDLLPHLKAVMSAIILGLFPLLSVFLVTPVFREAAKFMLGSVLWLTTWGVAIAITHTAAVDGALSAFTDIANNNMGLASFMFAEESAIKALSFFGRMQAMSLLIASSLAMALYKFGGYALTQMAHAQAHNIQNLGESSANSALTPEGRAGLRDNYAQALASEGAHPPTHAMTNQPTHQWGPTPEEASAVARLGQSFGQGQAALDRGAANGNGVMANTQDSSYASQTQQLADNQLLGQMQDLQGRGETQAGANLLSGSQSEQYAKLHNLQNIAGLQGYDPNSPQALMSINKDLADDGAIDMSAQEIMSNDMLKNQLNSSDRQLLQDNPNERFAVKPTFNQGSAYPEVSNVDISSYSDTSMNDNTTDSTINRQVDKEVVDTRDTTLRGSQTTTGHVHDSTTQTRIGGNVGTIRDALLNDGNQFVDNPQRLQTWGNNMSAFVGSYNQAKGGDVSAREQLVDATAEMFKDVQGTMSTQDMVSFYSKEDINGGWKVPGVAQFLTGANAGANVVIGSEQRTQSEEDIKSDINRSYINYMIDSSQGNVDFSENVRNLHEQQRNYAVGQGQDSDMKNMTNKN